MPEKCALTILELNWNQRLGQDKIEHLSSYAHVVHYSYYYYAFVIRYGYKS